MSSLLDHGKRIVHKIDLTAFTEIMKLFKWLRGSPRLTLFTELSPSEFAMAFDRSVERLSYVPLANLFKTGQMLGTLDGNRFKIQERTIHRNSGTPIFRGQFKGAGSGTEVSGYFSIDSISRLFMSIWFSFGISISGLVFLTAANSAYHGDSNSIWVAIGAFGVFILLSYAVLGMSVVRKKKEEKFVQFFKVTFGATLIERQD